MIAALLSLFLFAEVFEFIPELALGRFDMGLAHPEVVPVAVLVPVLAKFLDLSG